MSTISEPNENEPDIEHNEPKDETKTSGQTPSNNEAIPYDNPFDLPRWRRWVMTLALASMTLVVTFGSSVFSSTTTVLSAKFDVSPSIVILGVSLYVLGFALGPIVWGPLSEFKGRKLPLFGAYFIFTIMQIPLALGKDLPTILVCRLLAGCFGAAPVVIVSASYADFWGPGDRGVAVAVYSAAVYVGPSLGPIFGALLTESHLGWEWTAWLTLIMASVVGPLAYIIVPETYAPTLIERAAKKHNRNITLPGSQTKPKQSFVRTFLVKPIIMLFYEPMVRLR